MTAHAIQPANEHTNYFIFHIFTAHILSVTLYLILFNEACDVSQFK